MEQLKIENENLMSIENLRNWKGVQLTQEHYLKLKIGWNRAKKISHTWPEGKISNRIF